MELFFLVESMNSWVLAFFSLPRLSQLVAGREEAKNPSGGNVLRLIQIRLATLSFEKIALGCQDNSPQAKIADPTSRNGVNFSSTCPNESLTVAMSGHNPNCSPFAIHSCDATPTPSGFAVLLIIPGHLRCQFAHLKLCIHLLQARSKRLNLPLLFCEPGFKVLLQLFHFAVFFDEFI